MLNQLRNLYSELENSLYKIHRDEPDPLSRATICIQKIKGSCNEVSMLMEQQQLKDQQEYIFFFKQVKIPLYGKLFYHADIYDIESQLPKGTDKVKKRHLKERLYRISDHFNYNRRLYQYFYTDSKDLDDKYFKVINKYDLKYDEYGNTSACLDGYSCTHDVLFARIQANVELEKYLRQEIGNLNGSRSNDVSALPTGGKFYWTDSKAALIEIMYAVHSAGSINNGKGDIKELAELVETIFRIDLGDYYRSYIDLRVRSNPTRYLDKLKEALQARMDADNERGMNDPLLKRK